MKRSLLLGIFVYSVLIAGLISRNGALVALAFPLVLYLFVALFQRPEDLNLRTTRVLSETCVSQDTHVEVTLTLVNEGAIVEELLVADIVPPALTLVEGETRALATLASGETLTLSYTVSGKRGSYDFRDVHVTAYEHLGLFSRHKKLEIFERLLVLPSVLQLRRVPIRPLQTRGYAGPVPARRGGPGVDFYGVREYQAGDPLRWINWRISARHTRTIFTNEFEQERVADVGLILDARRRNDLVVNRQSLFEHSIQAAASLAGAFLNDGNRVGLLVYGRGLEWTFPGYGKVQREQILRALARARTGDSLVFESLDYLPTRFFPAKSQIVLVSPLCEDDPQMLVRLRARGYQVLVISPDPVSFEAERATTKDAVLAARLARLERTLLLRRLSGAGIQVVDWSVHAPFDRTVNASLGRTPLWFRAVGVTP